MIAPPPGHRTALLALGANLGDPLAQVRRAVERLRGHLGDLRVSPAYLSPPEGGAAQPDYVNAVVQGTWRGSARELLEVARALEDEAGRTRPFTGSSRTLDVDILFLGDLVIDESDLQLPHPRWSRRAFVVLPLLDVAPDWVDPVTGTRVGAVARERGWHAGTPGAASNFAGLTLLEAI